MTDQNSQFFAILTAVGEAKQANANALGVPWSFSQMGVGDASQTEPTPTREQTRLLNERRRAPLNQLSIDPSNASIIIAEQVIPPDVGGWWIREIGLYDADGDLVAVANCAPSYKPLLTQGTGKTQVVRLNLTVTSTANVVLKIDPAVVLATRQYVDQRIIEILPPTRTAGTYTKVTISARGVVVAGENPSTLQGYGIIDTYTAVAVDNIAGRKADKATTLAGYGITDAYTQAQAAALISGKADKATTLAGYGIKNAYTATEVDTALMYKANVNSPLFTGIPRADTASLGTNTSQLATCGFVVGTVNALVGAAPGALDTLAELGAALGNDPNYAATITSALGGKAPLVSPVFSGIPAGPTAPAGTSTSQLATTQYVERAIAAVAAFDPWAMQPIGVPLPVMFGAAAPPKDKAYRYILLTYGDPYNAGVLTEEVITGAAPLVTSYGRITLAGSPINGNTVYLLNTERRSIRPGAAGSNQDDAFQNISGTIRGGIPTFQKGTPDGPFSFSSAPSSQTGITAGGGEGIYDLTFDASRVARTSYETRVKNAGANFFMRIK